MFKFTVPGGDYDFNPKTRQYVDKDLVFTEKKLKRAKAAIKEYVDEGVPFTMVFIPKG